MDILLFPIVLSFLDPVRALITFLCLFASRGRWPIVIGGIVSAVICETLLTLLQYTYFWGQGIGAGTAASLLQAALMFRIARSLRNWRAAGSAAANSGT
jgi:hypothetical protein